MKFQVVVHHLHPVDHDSLVVIEIDNICALDSILRSICISGSGSSSSGSSSRFFSRSKSKIMSDNEGIPFFLFQVVVHHLHLVVVLDSSLVSIRYRSSRNKNNYVESSIIGTPSSSGSGHRVREAFRSLVRKPSTSGIDFSDNE